MTGTRVLMSTLIAVALLNAGGVLQPSVQAVPAAPAAEVALSECWSPDNGDPDLTGLSLSATTVNVTEGDAALRIEATVLDTGGPGPATGVQSVTVFADPSANGPPTLRPSATLLPTPAGLWVGDMMIRRGFTPGPWVIAEVSVLDGAEHQRQYVNRDLAARGLASTFTVVGAADQQRPVLRTLTVTPSRVIGDRFPVTVTVRATADDDLAGVKEIRVSAQQGEGGKYRRAVLRPVNGRLEAEPSSWIGTLTFGQRRDVGAWRLRADVIDELDRRVIVGPRRLRSLGLANEITVRDVDRGQPVLLDAQRTPATVDARSRDGVLNVRIRAADPVSGVEWARVTLAPRAERSYVFPTRELARVSGTSRDGVWRGQVVIPPCTASPGAHRVRVQLRDFSGNRRSIQLPDITVRAVEDRVRPTLNVAARPVAPNGPVTVVFDEDVTGITERTAVVRPGGYYRIYAAEPPSAITGGWTCRDDEGAGTSCSTGRVRTALFNPTMPLTPGRDYALEVNPEHTLGVLDMAGNPAHSFARPFTTAAGAG